MTQATNQASFIWSVADLLRGPFKQSEYGRVILPFTVLRRLECVLEPTRDTVLASYRDFEAEGLDLNELLPGVSGVPFYNISQYTLATLGQTNPRANLEDYVSKFSPNARGIFTHFAFDTWLDKLENANLLFLVAQEFAGFDLHPRRVSNMEMGHIFEHLVYKFAESANDTAGEYYTPRDVVRLATTLVIAPDHEALAGEGVIRTVYDPAAGTGGFLSAAIEQVLEWNPNARLVPYAQELNGETYAIQVADKLIQGYDTSKLKLGNTLSHDQLEGETFHYALSNPPFGTDWKGFSSAIEAEHKRGYAGRFGPGLPRVSDASMLFLLHLLSKRRPRSQGGSRMGIVLSGSPLFTGGAGSGESEIRRWILEEDLLETIVGLPTDLFYNTGIATYVWILSNAKEERRRGLVQLIDASDMHTSMRKSLGNKRKYLNDEQIAEIARLHDVFEEGPESKILPTTAFGFRRVVIERPLRLRFEITQHAMDRLLDATLEVSNPQYGPARGQPEDVKREYGERVKVYLAQALRQPKNRAYYDEAEFREYLMELFDTNPFAHLARYDAGTLRSILAARFRGLDNITDEDIAWMRTGMAGGLRGAHSYSSPAVAQVGAFLDSYFVDLPLILEAKDFARIIRYFGTRDPNANPVSARDRSSNTNGLEPDPDLRDHENVPLRERIDEYVSREVLPHVPDAWVDESRRDVRDGEVGIVGYEIPFSRHFYVYTPPRPLEEIDRDLKETTDRIKAMIERLAQ
jgi:type I restriction enzyme M protein